MEVKKFLNSHHEYLAYTANGCIPLSKCARQYNKTELLDIVIENTPKLKLDFNLMMSKSPPTAIINKKLHHELLHSKNKINYYRKYFYKYVRLTNPYELVNTSNSKYSVLDCNVLNRAYFKLWEIFTHIPDILLDKDMTYIALAEGPGGFIQSFQAKRKDYNDSIYAITLKDHHDMDFSEGLTDINITYGDVTNSECILKFVNKVSNKAHLITADGGIGVPNKYLNHQESYHIKLFFAEILLALRLQEIGGTFVLKMYDLFTLPSLQLIYILSQYYEQIHITKPVTSRPANSEKYIICKGFKGIKDSIIRKIFKCIQIINQQNNYFIHSFIDNPVPSIVLDSVNEYHSLIVPYQIKNIEKTLTFAANNITNKTKIINKQKQIAICWAKKHNIPVKKKYEEYLNV